MSRVLKSVGVCALLSATGLLLLAGCEQRGGMPLVPVSGRVTFDGGPCPTAGSISFVQIPGSGKAGLPNRPGRASFGTDGTFMASTFADGDGLLPGRYRVNVSCREGDPGPGRPLEQVSYVPLDWRPDELVVQEGQGSIEINFDVPPKKK